MLDVGTIGIGNTTVQACPYTLNVFDLTTDKILRQYKLRPEDVNQVYYARGKISKASFFYDPRTRATP